MLLVHALRDAERFADERRTYVYVYNPYFPENIDKAKKNDPRWHLSYHRILGVDCYTVVPSNF